MREHDIHYLPIAESDLNDVIDYLLEYSNKAASDFIDQLEKIEKRLSTFPESSPPIRDKVLKSKGYRVIVIGDYLLFYKLHKDAVYVMRIIHGKRNYLLEL